MKAAVIAALLMVAAVSGCVGQTETTGAADYATGDVACPRGLVNDTYPGECGSYIDSNENGICDRSE